MAQIRKHRPRTSSIGDQVRASVDSGPRPIVPGEEYDPFFEEPDDTAGEAAGGFEITASAATVVSTGGWFTLDSDAMAAMLASPAATTAADDSDEADEDDLDEDDFAADDSEEVDEDDLDED